MITESDQFTQIPSFKKSISLWTERLHKELMDRPISRNIEENIKEVEDIIEHLADLPNEYFTRVEADEMKEKLDILEKDLLERLTQLNLEKKEFETKQNELHFEIEQLKRTVEVLKKPGWAGSLMVRISDFVKNSGNEKLLKDSTTFIVKQLVEEGMRQLKA